MYCKHAWLHRQAAAHTRALLYRACQILAAGSSFSARSWVPSRHCAQSLMTVPLQALEVQVAMD